MSDERIVTYGETEPPFRPKPRVSVAGRVVVGLAMTEARLRIRPDTGEY
jgi:hypothetical protein